MVIHDVGAKHPEHSIVAIENGHVTGRKVGDGASHVVLEQVRQADAQPSDHLSYLTKTPDGKILKSSTMYIRGRNGKVVAILGINYDISSLLMVEDAVHELIDTKDKTQGEPEKIVNVNDLLDELKGPLAERFEVSGPLSGNAAAIYISRNAWVKNINIVNGAALSGDIISDWNPGNSDVQQAQAAANGDDLLTSLSFGRLAAGDGSATDAPDPDFRLRYDGNILGRHSIRMSVGGGALSFNGRAEVLDVNVREGATLSGNAEYTLNALDNGYVSVDGNAGTVAPGNSIGTITINGDYHQTATGRLFTEFDASGTSDRLAVNGNAVVNGTLYLAPLPGYYAGSLSLTPITASGNLTEAYATNLLLDSPTLEMAATPQGGTATILSSRAADAYSRYAANGNAAAVSPPNRRQNSSVRIGRRRLPPAVRL